MIVLLTLLVCFSILLVVYRMLHYKFTKYNLENVGLLGIAYIVLNSTDNNSEALTAIKVVLLLVIGLYFLLLLFVKGKRNEE